MWRGCLSAQRRPWTISSSEWVNGGGRGGREIACILYCIWYLCDVYYGVLMISVIVCFASNTIEYTSLCRQLSLGWLEHTMVQIIWRI